MKRLATPFAVLFLLATAWTTRAEPVTCTVDFDRPVVFAGKPEKVVIKVGLTAPKVAATARRMPINLAIVLDRSGSMQGDKLARAKEGAIAALGRLSENDTFSLITYDTTVQTVVESRRAGDHDSIVRAIQAIQCGGSTNLFGGVSQGAAELRKQSGRDVIHRLILLSDGLANVGPSSPDDLARLGAALIKEGISVTTIGVGLDYNEDLMTGLSRASDGYTYFVENSADLPRIFDQELGEVISICARKVIIEIECMGGARPSRVIGRDGRMAGNKVEIYLNQLYGGEEKYALLEVEVPAGTVGARREVARVACRYDSVLDNRSYESSQRAAVTYTEAETEVIRNMREHVVTALVINERAIARQQAIALLDQGKKDEASEVLKRNEAYNVQQRSNAGANKWANALFIDGHVEGGKAERSKLEREGLDNRSRKGIVTDYNQSLMQQDVKP